MLRSPLLLIVCFLFSFPALAQESWEAPRVGRTIHFANMRLHLSEKAREDIQADVDALYRSPKYFKLKLERVDMYMPLIRPVLAQNQVPDDLKYLVIQESALISDAVSSSDAVGFWQFKDFTAAEYGLRVDRQVDERKNIISSTNGAARYLLKSNAVFDNWLYSLLSYNIGLGGAMRSLDKKEYGAREMRIDHDTHWYIKKFLSHLVAFEPVLGRTEQQTVLHAYTQGADKSLRQIAQEFEVEEELLAEYNKWLQTHRVPTDREYTLIIPLQEKKAAEQPVFASSEDASQKKEDVNENTVYGHKQRLPSLEQKEVYAQFRLIRLNGLRAIIARKGDTASGLAREGNISLDRFLRYNELLTSDKIEEGQVYYFQRKRGKARVYEHVLKPGETLWQVAQQYGIRLHKLRQKNRLKGSETLVAGRVLWLRFIRPSGKDIEYRSFPFPEKQEQPMVKEKAEEEKALVEVAEELPAEVAAVKPQSVHTAEADTVSQALAPDTLSAKPISALSADSVLFPATVDSSTNAVAAKVTPVTPDEMQEVRKFSEENAELSVPDEMNDTDLVLQPARETDVVSAEEIIHVVEAGETLYALSRKYEVGVSDLMRWNDLGTQPILSIGQELRIRRPKTSPQARPEEKPAEQQTALPHSANARYHTVEAGESMYRVARLYEVTIKDIMQWNGKETFDVQVGERLIVGFVKGTELPEGQPKSHK